MGQSFETPLTPITPEIVCMSSHLLIIGSRIIAASPATKLVSLIEIEQKLVSMFWQCDQKS